MTVVIYINLIAKREERLDDQYLTSLSTSRFPEITHELKEYVAILQMQFYLVSRQGLVNLSILFYSVNILNAKGMVTVSKMKPIFIFSRHIKMEHRNAQLNIIQNAQLSTFCTKQTFSILPENFLQ